MAYQWEMEKIKDWTTNDIKNYIWMEVECGQPIPRMCFCRSITGGTDQTRRRTKRIS